jgi:hypothetical protein
LLTADFRLSAMAKGCCDFLVQEHCGKFGGVARHDPRFTRRGNDWTTKYPAIAEAVAKAIPISVSGWMTSWVRRAGQIGHAPTGPNKAGSLLADSRHPARQQEAAGSGLPQSEVRHSSIDGVRSITG